MVAEPMTLALAPLEVNRILCGDALETLRTLPSESVHCVVTSPPYFGQRDYGVEGQLGLETTPTAYLSAMVAVFAEIRRVLRSDGTCWVNMGDSYANDGKWGGRTGGKHAQGLHGMTGVGRGKRSTGLKAKELVGMPWMLAFALRDDGWRLRSDIIWHKPNAMPESVRDRPSMDHEHLFLLTKRPRYYYDADAIREPHRSLDRPPGNKSRIFLDRDPQHHTGEKRRPGQEQSYHEAGRNKRTVWTIATRAYKGAHFATFPPALVEPCILAGTSPRVCERCGAPWRRQVERTFIPQPDVSPERDVHQAESLDASSGWVGFPRGSTRSRTLGWRPTCRCAGNTGAARAVVLDPFMGAGTTAVVARRHSRSYLGIELKADYIALAEARIAAEIQPVLWSSATA